MAPRWYAYPPAVTYTANPGFLVEEEAAILNGPGKADVHYKIPPLEPTLRRLIDQQAYFVSHAPRRVGKTTTVLELAGQLTEAGKYAESSEPTGKSFSTMARLKR